MNPHTNAECSVGACPSCLDTRDPLVWSAWLTRQTTALRSAHASNRTFRVSAPRGVPEPPDLNGAIRDRAHDTTSPVDRVRENLISVPHAVGPAPARTVADSLKERVPSPDFNSHFSKEKK